MKKTQFVGMVGLLLLAGLANDVIAQQGEPIVWVAPSTQLNSPAYLDASTFSGSDICAQINAALLKLASISKNSNNVVQGGIIDARGVFAQPPNKYLPCITNPFSGVTVPATVLLPATIIGLSTTWVLPSNTRLVGENSQDTQITIDQNASSFSSPIISMGSAALCPNTCTGISVEHLKIIGQDTGLADRSTDGIDNNYAGYGSYVSDVSFSHVGATSSGDALRSGLLIGSGAVASGPYSDINFVASSACAEMSVECQGSGSTCTCHPTACVVIQAQTQGLHGLTCTAYSANNFISANGPVPPSAAIYLDSYNTTVENAHIEGFYDGVVVGDNPGSGNVAGDTIANVTSAFSRLGPVWHTVHICNPTLQTQPFPNSACQYVIGSGANTVSNINVFHVLSLGGTSVPQTSIQDDLNTTAVNSATSATVPAFVGTYTVGAQPSLPTGLVAYSRLTVAVPSSVNSASTPTWGAYNLGNINTTTTPLGSCNTPGSLFSNPGGTANSKNTIFYCSGGNWTFLGN